MSPKPPGARAAATAAAVLAPILVTVTVTACAELPVSESPEPSPASATPLSAEAGAVPLAYPPAPRDGTVDVHHGVSVPDPFRPLEDADAPASRAWIEAENALTESFLAAVPERAALRARLDELWNYERFGIPRREGGRVFYQRNDGRQQQSVLWVVDAEGAEPRVLLDPNTLSADGTVAVGDVEPSPDGRLLAYSLRSGGSDWEEWHVRDVATGKDLPDRLRWVKFSGASWLPDASAFYYSRYDEPQGGALKAANYHQKLFVHRIGTDQAEDRLVLARPDQKEWGFSGSVTDDGAFLGIHVWRGTLKKNAFFYRDLRAAASGGAPIVELLRDWDASYSFLGNAGTEFFFRTDLDAARGRVIAIDTARPERAAWRTVVPEAADTLEGVSLVGGRIVCQYLHDAAARVRVFETDGRPVRDVALPGLGSVNGFSGRTDRPETWFGFTGFQTPFEIWSYDVATGRTEIFRRPKVAFRPEDLETQQVFVASGDGTRVPLFLTYRKGLVRDGAAPCILTGYGGFDIAQTPYFSVQNLVWMERGGVLASACLRGGGEYGREWHEAGTKLRKQNTFDDFIACAEWLVRERWTSTPRLAISGGSNGGLLVGACMTQRPELFGAALPAVGVLDMLRYHTWTIGWAWKSDYGSAEDEAEFRALLAYSPLHNVRKGTAYPPTLVTTGDHDDRVFPAHSMKFAAALQEAQGGPAPVLIRIETRAGHGAGKPMSKVIDEAADRMAFLVRVFGL